jgi:hypothetical protein
VTRQCAINSKLKALAFRAKTIEDFQKVDDFKTLCIQDGLEIYDLMSEAIDLVFKKHHWPPGNPQLLLERFQEGAPVMVPNCKCGRPSVTHGVHLSSNREFDYCKKCFSEVPQRYDGKIWRFTDISSLTAISSTQKERS